MSHSPRIARGIAAAVVLNLAFASIVAASQAGPAYIAVDSWSATAVSQNTVRLSATTNGAIPKSPDDFISSNAIVGIAWADLGTGTALVATIHPVIGRDSNQRPGQWHLHTVQLGGGATSPNDFCLVAVVTTPTAGLRIQGSTMTIDIAASKLPVPVGALDAAVGFTVHGGEAGCATGLGVRLRS
jgi:hypothetical protein